MRSLHTRLGPIKGVTFPAARRLVGALRAGFAVPHYSALEFCPVIWISVAEESLDEVLRDLAEQTPMHKTVIVICGSQRESTSFDVLRHRGARVATLDLLDDSWQSSFVAEGHPDAIREIRKLVAEDQRRLIELRAGTKHVFRAGLHMLSDLLRPWTAAAVDCLCASGVPRHDAMEFAELLSLRAVRAYTKSGSQPWSGQAKQKLVTALEKRADALRPLMPREAELYAEGVRLALEYFQRRQPASKPAAHHASVGHRH
jgi:hypothetical protein